MKSANTCLYSTTRTPERESQFYWIGKITNLTTALFAKAGRGIKLETLEDAKQFSIAVMKDDYFHQSLLRKGVVENQNLYVNNSYAALSYLLDIPNRQIDLVIANAAHMPYRLSDNQTLDDVEMVLDVKELQSELYLACNKKTDPELVSSLKNSMKKLADSGELVRIERTWIAQSKFKSL
ncbi:MAG: transporter substrate-binding domain-containing protein [Alteromonadaceae bacterium]|nr:transporter substrate-binding domain-containing protein [Alteromonadaceae bacterium]